MPVRGSGGGCVQVQLAVWSARLGGGHAVGPLRQRRGGKNQIEQNEPEPVHVLMIAAMVLEMVVMILVRLALPVATHTGGLAMRGAEPGVASPFRTHPADRYQLRELLS